MINPKNFFDRLTENGIDFYSGVPDSLLKNICAYITDNAPKKSHIIAANEGNAVALASGYHMATRKVPMVYMQNSGVGNAVNPLLSLVDKEVYNIPMLLMVGWRGKPGVKDEPQHITQGAVTLQMFEAMNIPYQVLSTYEAEALTQVDSAISEINKSNTPFVLVIEKGTFENYSIKEKIVSEYKLSREEAIKSIINELKGDEIIVSTTGKTSRELFEYRKNLNHPHHFDFLTVGSMGHSNQIALGIAMGKPDKKIICLDGDGAILMHAGSLAIIGCEAPKNLLHIVINNGAHESVGGQPTVGFQVDIPAMALASNYKTSLSVSTSEELISAMKKLSEENYPALIEVKVRVGSRDDLGRPTIKPVDNKKDFMNNLNS